MPLEETETGTGGGGEGGGENGCGCCALCESAGDNQLVYCHQGTWRTLAAPTNASYLAFDPVDGFRWVAVLAAAKPAKRKTPAKPKRK